MTPETVKDLLTERTVYKLWLGTCLAYTIVIKSNAKAKDAELGRKLYQEIGQYFLEWCTAAEKFCPEDIKEFRNILREKDPAEAGYFFGLEQLKLYTK